MLTLCCTLRSIDTHDTPMVKCQCLMYWTRNMLRHLSYMQKVINSCHEMFGQTWGTKYLQPLLSLPAGFEDWDCYGSISLVLLLQDCTSWNLLIQRTRKRGLNLVCCKVQMFVTASDSILTFTRPNLLSIPMFHTSVLHFKFGVILPNSWDTLVHSMVPSLECGEMGVDLVNAISVALTLLSSLQYKYMCVCGLCWGWEWKGCGGGGRILDIFDTCIYACWYICVYSSLCASQNRMLLGLAFWVFCWVLYICLVLVL